jgi:hypothetical protein
VADDPDADDAAHAPRHAGPPEREVRDAVADSLGVGWGCIGFTIGLALGALIVAALVYAAILYATSGPSPTPGPGP